MIKGLYLLLGLSFFLFHSVWGQEFSELSTDPIYNLNHAWGVAIGDYDNDGDDDIFIPAHPSRLLINQGNMEFIVDQAHFNSLDAKVGVWIDIDNDGWLDMVTSSWENSAIYMNQGDGTFLEEGKLRTSKRQAILVGDLNGDQWVDLYTSNFRQPNELLLNDGKGYFVNRIAGSGAEAEQQGMGGILIDIDQDQDLDIYLVFDGKESNFLFINDGAGRFIEAAQPWGLDTRTQGMGTDYADFNGDGAYDFYITNLFHNNFMISQPDGTYQNMAPGLGMDDNGMAWGLVVLDYDNDGLPDIYVNNKYGFSQYPNLLYKNKGDLVFENVAQGHPIENTMAGFGCGVSDLNNDGLSDLLVINEDPTQSVRIFENKNTGPGNWIQFSLVGTTSNKFGVGSRISVYSGGREWTREVTIGTGYSTQNSYRLHFGIGEEDVIDSVIIHWPDKTIYKHELIASDTRYLAIQGEELKEFDRDSYRVALTSPSQLPPPENVSRDIYVEGDFSVARIWNEALLFAIREDLARPTVHARNLFHSSLVMYDAWAAYASTSATTVFLGKTFQGYSCPFNGIEVPEDIPTAQEEAISYAMYRLLYHRFQTSPGVGSVMSYLENVMHDLGYDPNFTSQDYVNGPPAALGNYLASQMIDFGMQDGSNEEQSYTNLFYQPVNNPLDPKKPGNPNITNPNRWQPLALDFFIDQSGIEVGSVPPFLGPEWGYVKPFALKSKDLKIRERDGHQYWIYHDPGPPPSITQENGLEDLYKWNHTMVAVWSGHLDPSNEVMVDISPGGNGNNMSYPVNQEEFRDFYEYENGGDKSTGYAVNPYTGESYQPQIVPLGDYTRVLAEFWADGPDSETPPGHWFTLLNHVSDHPLFKRKMHGVGDELSPLEWDVKSYLIMGGAMHDVAITAWGLKGYYDYVRPISAIRYMAMKGQSTNPTFPRYHAHGLPLIPGKVEMVMPGDPLAGENNLNLYKIKVLSWKGPDYIQNPDIDVAGVDWILAENWYPYQRPTFVTPPFAGYISGHSTFSSAAAEVMTLMTGDEYFPGGLGEFYAPKDEFLVFEEGPSVDIHLQWARYRDASDHSSISRIWGGIHPAADDIPGRNIGIVIGRDAFYMALDYFENTITSVDPTFNQLHTIIYPNPVRGGEVLHLELDENPNKAVLIDITGRQVHTFSEKSLTSRDWTLPSLSAGIYLLQMDYGKSRETLRLAIE